MSSMATNEVRRGLTGNLVGTTGDLEARCGCGAALVDELLDWIRQRVIGYNLTQGNCAEEKYIQCTHGGVMARVSSRRSHLDSGQEFTINLEVRPLPFYMPDVGETRAHAKSYCHYSVAEAQSDATVLEGGMDWQHTRPDDVKIPETPNDELPAGDLMEIDGRGSGQRTHGS
ncbi:hypothetical protein LZ32DRAFT_612182 [Colletotrichum eremochloae]|nr:hypothetical protein LZ32DRAFT_612182 [Colletotrichum eremochloae]